MYYYKQTKTDIEKYEVSYDEQKLKELKEKIINDCSFVEYMEYESDYAPRKFKTDDYEIRHYRYVDTGRYKEYFEETRSIYIYRYNKYIYPDLVKSINKVLKGNAKGIDVIFNYNGDDEDSSLKYIEEQIKKTSDEVDKIPNTCIEEKIKKLKELEELIKRLEELKKENPLNEYYKEVKNLFILKKVGAISKSEIVKILSFFNNKNEEEFNFDNVCKENCLVLKK